MSDATTPTAEMFEAHIGAALQVACDDGSTLALTLETVTRGPAGSFSLDLTGPRAPVLAALTYPVTLPDGAAFPLFISAHGQSAEATFYGIVAG